MFAMSMSDNLFYGFLLFCFLCWYGMRIVRDLDRGGEIKKAARAKFLSTLTRWLK
jgi:hypothetical protein